MAWLPADSTVVEPARSDMARCAGGGAMRSSLAIRYQLGFERQAGSVIEPPKAPYAPWRGQRGAESMPPRTLQGRDVVDPTVVADIERHRSRHAFAFEASDQHVEGAVIDVAENPEDAEVLEPVRW
jgi:hypothetical protein